MTLRIEIHEQPERSRFWAEVEVGGMIARRREVTSPKEDGLSGILAVVFAAAAEMDPRFVAPKPKQDDTSLEALLLTEAEFAAASDEEMERLANGIPDEAFAGDAGYDATLKARLLGALRAEAEAAGVDVDRRWGEARLRREIASARTPLL